MKMRVEFLFTQLLHVSQWYQITLSDYQAIKFNAGENVDDFCCCVQLVLHCTCEHIPALVQPYKWNWTYDIMWKRIKVNFILVAGRIGLFWFFMCHVRAASWPPGCFGRSVAGTVRGRHREESSSQIRGAKIQQIFIKTDEGPNSNSAAFCILMMLTMGPLLFLTPPFTPQ